MRTSSESHKVARRHFSGVINKPMTVYSKFPQYSMFQKSLHSAHFWQLQRKDISQMQCTLWHHTLLKTTAVCNHNNLKYAIINQQHSKLTFDRQPQIFHARRCRRCRSVSQGQNAKAKTNISITITGWLYCVECPQCSIRLEALGYLCTNCLLPAFHEAQCHVTQQSKVIGCLRLSDVSITCHVVNPCRMSQIIWGGILHRVRRPWEWLWIDSNSKNGN